jgi:hypothetical protein
MYTIRKRKYSLKKKSTKRKNTMKYRGGQYQEQGPSQYQDQEKDASQYQDQEEHSNEEENNHPGIIRPAFKAVKNLANKAASLTFSGINSLTGVNIENTESTNNALENAYKTLSDPETKENISRVVGEGAQVAAIALEAASPAINKFMEKTTDAVEKSVEKVGKAMVNIAMNTAEEIPGAGVIIGTVRSLDKGAQAAQSVLNAFSDTATNAGDTANEIKRKYKEAQEQLHGLSNMDLETQMQNKIKERTNIQNYVGGSITEFQDTTLNPEKFKTKINNITKRKKTLFRNTKSRHARK